MIEFCLSTNTVSWNIPLKEGIGDYLVSRAISQSAITVRQIGKFRP